MSTKLSQIASAGATPASTDTVVGVQTSGPTDLLYTLAQVSSAVATINAMPTDNFTPTFAV